MIIRLFLLQILLGAAAFAAGEKELSPSEKFLSVVTERNETFQKFRTKLYAEEVCPGPDYACVLKELKATGIQSSADLDNGVSLLSWVAQKRYQRGDCQEVCRMNIYAEYSAAVVDLLGSFERKNIVVNLFPTEHAETKYLIINEELRLYKAIAKLHEKIIQHRKKVDPTKIFRPELAKRMEGFKSEIDGIRPSILLKGSYLSALDPKDQVMALIIEEGMKSEREKLERRALVSQFREEIR